MTSSRPICAYRFQFTAEDNFRRAASLVPYLAALGVSHLYMSPISEAVPGSQHGYDVVDPHRVRDELGGEAAFAELIAQLDAHEIGWILDIVPNHLSSADPESNPWFWDVLRFGQASRYADTFDIDWDAADGQLILPVVDRPPSELFESGALEIVERNDEQQLQINGGFHLPIDPASIQPDRSVLEIVEHQHYRLVPWRSTERNVRRFFEIDSLVAVAIEKPHVRAARHELLARMIERFPSLSGVRVDHIDGLADPDGYLHWLRSLIGPDRLLLVEKILLGDEQLPDRWPVDGTTGYEFARITDRLLLEHNGQAEIELTYRRLTGDRRDFHAVETDAIREVLTDRLRPDVRRVAELAGRPEDDVIALAASFDRYRTYLPHGSTHDIDYLRTAAAKSTQGGRDLAEVVIDPSTEDERKAASLFQQLTGPALAKGIEDRAIYRFAPLAALNEVGGSAVSPPADIGEWHRWAADRAQRHPRGMLTTSTHDTKRSGDVRARLLALTRHHGKWRSFAERWMETPTSDVHPIDRYFVLQHAVGAWPIPRDRLIEYVRKALREAAERSSWIDTDHDYEANVETLVAELLSDEDFVDAVEGLVGALETDALANTLAQTLLRLATPGFGDLYRGDEVIDLSLVDPDNRRPLDWGHLAATAETARQHDLASAMGVAPTLAKTVLIQRTLAALRDCGTSGYEPLAAPHRVLAFRRDELVVIVDLRADRTAVDAVELPSGRWTQRLVDRPGVIEGSAALGVDSLPVQLLGLDGPSKPPAQ